MTRDEIIFSLRPLIVPLPLGGKRVQFEIAIDDDANRCGELIFLFVKKGARERTTDE